MSEDIYEALARTALLIELDIFGAGADHRRIVDGLRSTTARIIADRANVSSPAGQTALVTLYAQLAMIGLQIDLDIPTVDLLTEQPPLRGCELVSGLVDYSDDLLPGGSSRAATPDVTFALGDTPAPTGAVRVAGNGWRARVGRGITTAPWRGVGPVGAMAAAAAAAVEGLRAAVPRIAEHLQHPAPDDSRWRNVPGRQVELSLDRYRVDGAVHLGDVDIVSGGAITNAAMYALLRVPALTATMRIVEPEPLDLSNLNRYALARRSTVSLLKTRILEAFSTTSIGLSGVDTRLDDHTLPSLGSLAPRLLVGVDDIPSRWVAQRAAATSWVCVGASSHDFVIVSAHPPGLACAGCVHTRDEPTIGQIPTISFVSFWAGLTQALELVAHAAERSPAWTMSTHIWPFGLENRRGVHQFRQDAAAGCPARCAAATALPKAGLIYLVMCG